MSEIRAKRYNEFLKQEIGKIIFNFLDVKPSVLVTVTRVITATNLFHAVIFVSVFPTSEAEAVLQKINRSVYEIQQILNRKFRVRPVPKIRFEHDKNPEEAAEIEKLIEETKHEKPKF